MSFSNVRLEQSPSVSFDDRVPHPALSSHDARHGEARTARTSLHQHTKASASSPREEPPSLLDIAWAWDVLQWASGKAEGTSNLDGVMPFAQATAGASALTAPVWSPFRTLSWDPAEGKARLRNAQTALPLAAGGFVFDQGPGSFRANRTTSRQTLTLTRGEEEEALSRNAVSLAAIARMEGLASPCGSEGSGAGVRPRWSGRSRGRSDMVSGHRGTSSSSKASRAAMRLRRAIQFELHDVCYTQRYNFSASRTIKLTSSFFEAADDHSDGTVAYCFRLFGPVGLILRLHGGLHIFVVFRTVEEAEIAHAFFQQAMEKREQHWRRQRIPTHETRKKGLWFFTPTRAHRHDVGAAEGQTPIAKRKKKAMQTPSNSQLDHRVLSPATPVAERSSTLNSSSKGNSTSASKQSVRNLDVPAGGWLNLRPLVRSNRASGVSSTGPVSSGEGLAKATSRKFRKMYARPSQATRRYIRTLPEGSILGLGNSRLMSATVGGDSSLSGPNSGVGALLAEEDRFHGGTGPLVVHLSRSRALWWQRLKHALGPAPASLAIDVRRARATNLSSGGTSFALALELPSSFPLSMDRALGRIVGTLTRGRSTFASHGGYDNKEEECVHAEMEASLPSAAAKEQWLRWLELLGATVEWTQPAVIPPPAQRTEPAASLQAVDNMATSEGVRRSASRELNTPGDVLHTATPLSDSHHTGTVTTASSPDGAIFADTVNDRAQEVTPPANAVRRRDLYLHDTTSSRSSSTSPSPTPAQHGQARPLLLVAEDAPPPLPLQEGASNLYRSADAPGTKGASENRDGDRSETVSLDAMGSPTASEASPLPTPPPAEAARAELVPLSAIQATPPTPMQKLTRGWRVIDPDEETNTGPASPGSRPPPQALCGIRLFSEPSNSRAATATLDACAYHRDGDGSAERSFASSAGSETSALCSLDVLADYQEEGGASDGVAEGANANERQEYDYHYNENWERTPDGDEAVGPLRGLHDSPGGLSVRRRSTTCTPSPPSQVVSPESTTAPVSASSASPVKEMTSFPATTLPPPPLAAMRPANALPAFLDDSPRQRSVVETLVTRPSPPMISASGLAEGADEELFDASTVNARDEYSQGDSIPPPPSSECSTDSDIATPAHQPGETNSSSDRASAHRLRCHGTSILNT